PSRARRPRLAAPGQETGDIGSRCQRRRAARSPPAVLPGHARRTRRERRRRSPPCCARHRRATAAVRDQRGSSEPRPGPCPAPSPGPCPAPSPGPWPDHGPSAHGRSSIHRKPCGGLLRKLLESRSAGSRAKRTRTERTGSARPGFPQKRQLTIAALRAVLMLDGQLLVDAHVHVARLPSLSDDWQAWARRYGALTPLDDLFESDGMPRPAALDAHFAAQGADHVLLFTEHSPKVTGIQPIEDVLPVVRHNPGRFHPVANLNPHLHYPMAAELARQVDLGAIAVKIHPVHGGFEARDRMLYPAYAWACERGLPVIVHCGTSTFAGSVNSYADPVLLDEVMRDFPDLLARRAGRRAQRQDPGEDAACHPL